MRSSRYAAALLIGLAICGNLAVAQEGCRFLLDCDSRTPPPPTSNRYALTIQSVPFFNPQFQAVGTMSRQTPGSVQIELQSGGFYKSPSRPVGESSILRGVSVAFCHTVRSDGTWSGRLWIPVASNISYLIDESHS